MATTLQDFAKDLGLLVESGLIAIKQGDEESAKKLFNAVGVVDPKSTMKKMGFALIAIHKMDIKNGIKLFSEIISVEPDNHRAQAFLGFAYVLSTLKDDFSHEEKATNLKKGAEIAAFVLDKSDNPSTRQLAQSVLDWETEMSKKAEAKKA